MEINIENIYKKFDGKEVLKGVTLKIPNKKSTIILGKSGCGKSVLLKIIYKLIIQDKGLIKYNSEENVDINNEVVILLEL